MAQRVFSDDQANQVNMFDKLFLSVQLTKLCARPCGIMNQSNSSYSLTPKEKECMNVCGQNVNLTYGNFMNKMREEIDLQVEEEDGDGDDE